MASRKAASHGMTSSLSYKKPTAHHEVGTANRRLQRIVSGEDANGITYGEKLLTEAAKTKIIELLKSRPANIPGFECGRPALMLPSPKPLHYSFWCTLCQDRNTAILLCAGCRVGLCTQNEDDLHTGCLKASPEFRKVDLVFYCPFCCERLGTTFKFTITRPLPPKRNLFFRYDPPTLFIDLHLPGHCSQFGNIMKSNLEMLYKGNLEALHCLKIKLGQTRKMDASKRSKVQEFLAKNPLAKIVVILDTHSTQDGEIVSNVDDDLSTDHLGPILMMYLPDEVKKFVESPSTISHSHRTFILALTCGSHIMIEKARDSLTAQHCAEVVLSFGVGAVVPAMVSGPLPEFIMKWVATPLPLMDIVTDTMTSTYVERCAPVFSGKDFGHFTLVKDSVFMLGGRRIKCERCIEQNLNSRSSRVEGSRDRHQWEISCRSCGFITKYKHPDDDEISEDDRDRISKVPGTNLIRTPYPVPLAHIMWRKKQAPTSDTSSSTNVKRSTAQQIPRGVPPPIERRTSKRDRQDSDPSPQSRGLTDQCGGSTKSVQKKRSRT